VAWLTTSDVMVAAGLDPAAPIDVEWLEEVTAAAEDWAREQRRAAGYGDDPDPLAPAPSPRVKAGTVLYALDAYRSRGTYGGAAAFDGLGAVDLPAPVYAKVLGYLGIPRATVDAPDWYAPTDELATYRRRRAVWP
jgi:hypothetical protein